VHLESRSDVLVYPLLCVVWVVSDPDFEALSEALQERLDRLDPLLVPLGRQRMLEPVDVRSVELLEIYSYDERVERLLPFCLIDDLNDLLWNSEVCQCLISRVVVVG
jgi:hypothetical protein